MIKPDKMGSYKEEDVTFLLRDISSFLEEVHTTERESLIQSGTHYSEMLPKEYQPSEHYVSLFHQTLSSYSKRIAIAVGVVAEQINQKNGIENLVLVSLARAGTPIGVLIKRYIAYRFGVDVAHYSISIIRGRGIDQVALDYIFEKHPQAAIQFVDGWTGKGAITSELEEAVNLFNKEKNKQVSADLAVLADPGHCVSIYGTRDDFLIPSACLNSTVSGLVSRTVLNYDFMEKEDFHGAKYYEELASSDLSNFYIDTIAAEYPSVIEKIEKEYKQLENTDKTPTWKGIQSVKRIQKDFNISSSHFVKPGVGETTRVLLRRVPWKVLVNPNYAEDLTHILLLAKEQNVPVEEYSEMTYACCGIIKEL